MIDFPVIKNISDILPHIEGRSEFVVADKGSYIIINYNVMFEDTFLHAEEEGISAEEKLTRQMRRECRGIIFDSNTGSIIRRPYHKFKNVNEAPETQADRINLSHSHSILEKLDGSMVAAFAHAGNIIYGTKMVAPDFHELVKTFVDTTDVDYEGFCRKVIAEGYTPIFEFMHPDKRIVIDYGETPSLTLTAIRNIITGEYVPL